MIILQDDNQVTKVYAPASAEKYKTIFVTYIQSQQSPAAPLNPVIILNLLF